MIRSKSTSVAILEKKIHKLFIDRINSRPVFPGPNENLTQHKVKDILDIVLMGDVLTVLASLKLLNNQKVRLWALSNAHANLIAHHFNLPRKNIGVIPRYRIFLSCKEPRFFPKKTESMTLVLVGRWRIHKNIERAIKVADLIRSSWGKRVKIVISLGNALDIKMAQQFLSSNPHLKNINLEKNGVNWTRNIEKKYTSPILLNLSEDLAEDFGVSLAQAEVRGWPVIISPWGGHLDATSSWKMWLNPASSQSKFEKIFSRPLLPLVAPSVALNELVSPVVTIYKKNNFVLKRETILEIIFSKQLKVGKFDKSLRLILRGKLL